MAQRMGMAFALQIVIVVVVILVAAFLVLTYFAGGVDQAAVQISKWMGQVDQPLPLTCANVPTQACAATCAPGKAGLGTCPSGQVCCKNA